MRLNLQVAEGLAKRVRARGGEVLTFTACQLSASIPDQETRTRLLSEAWGHGPVGVLVEPGERETELVFRWEERRG